MIIIGIITMIGLRDAGIVIIRKSLIREINIYGYSNTLDNMFGSYGMGYR